jgi:hexosaminidase
VKTISPIAATLLCLSAATSYNLSASTNSLAIIPLPQRVELRTGTFKVTTATRVYTDVASRETGAFLVDRLRQSTGYPFTISSRIPSIAALKDGIVLSTLGANTNVVPEGYALTVTPDTVLIRAPTQAGLFYGVQTLFQLFPPVIFSTNLVTNVDWQIPCVHIEDWPRFKWRGFMLDVSRHFFNKSEVETILDTIAIHKLNRFHWHLVDDHGWRLEIKKYPKLTQAGAWRSGVGFNLDPKSTTPYGPDGRYGGFYTQDDVREIVAYAAARHITIVPEIEMPGHSTAALAAYPEFSCTGGPFTPPLVAGVFNGIYCPAKEETFVFLEDVLTEVFRLFPGKYIHIGGDEVPKEDWKKNQDCQTLMKREGLKNEEELQSWFIRRIEKFVNAHGRSLIGWSEILQGGLAQNATVMDWIGGVVEAASAGHDVVMTPTGFCYFDQYQSEDHSNEPKAADYAGAVTLNKVYSFDPTPTNLPLQYQSHILGAQGNLWTEYVPSLKHAEYMIFPRLCALAEVDWSSQSASSFDDFSRRLEIQCQRFDLLGVNYRRPSQTARTSSSAK